MSLSDCNNDRSSEMKTASSRSFDATNAVASEVFNRMQFADMELDGKTVADYLPPFAYACSKKPHLSNVHLRIDKDPVSGKNVCTMQIVWSDDFGKTNKSGSATSSRWSDEFTPVRRYVVRCDGPCGTIIYDEDELVQFGLCDHNVCRKCIRSYKNVELFDGSPGCCNSTCVKRNTKDRYHMTDNSVTCSSRSCSWLSNASSRDRVEELYLVKFIIFEKNADGKITRRIVDRELSSRDRMTSVNGILKQLIPDLIRSKVFLTTLTSFTRKDLIPLEPYSVDRRRLQSITRGDDIINILIARKGVSIKQ